MDGYEVRQITLLAAFAHATSTVTIGIVLSCLGKTMAEHVGQFTYFIAPAILVLMGIFFIYRHHRHKHFHVDENVVRKQTKARILTALVIAMFFSPCMEIEAYFLLAGAEAKWLVWCMALMYIFVTTTGIVLFVNFAYKGLLKLDWHSLEHNAGIITGVTLFITGIITFFIH